MASELDISDLAERNVKRSEEKKKTNLVVTLLERLLTETSPVVLAIDSFGHLERNVQVPALDSKVEASSLVLNKVEGNLCVRA